MKRVVAVLTLLLFLVMLAACNTVEFLSEVGEQLSTLEDEVSAPDTAVVVEPSVPNNPEASAADTQPYTPADEPDTADMTVDEPGQADGQASEDTSTDGTAAPDTPYTTDAAAPNEDGNGEASAQPESDHVDPGINYTALTAEMCVTDAWPEAPGVMPRITVGCDGADQLNSTIITTFEADAGNPEMTVHYEVYKNDRVLSILMVVQTPYDMNRYTPYNLDLATGNAISGHELLDLLAQDAGALAQIETAVMGEEFTHQYGHLREEMGELYDQQYRQTTDVSNAETENIWLDSVGQLCFVGRIYDLDGVGFYEYPMGSTLVFQ